MTLTCSNEWSSDRDKVLPSVSYLRILLHAVDTLFCRSKVSWATGTGATRARADEESATATVATLGTGNGAPEVVVPTAAVERVHSPLDATASRISADDASRVDRLFSTDSIALMILAGDEEATTSWVGRRGSSSLETSVTVGGMTLSFPQSSKRSWRLRSHGVGAAISNY